MIIAITGTLGSGKGTIVEHLKKRGFKHYSVGRFLVEEIGVRRLEINRDNMVLVANDLRKNFGSSYIIEQIYDEAMKEGGNFVIESVRAIGEAEFFKSMENCYLFSVNADIETRYERIKKRNGSKDNVSFEEFASHEKREFDSGDPSRGNLKACMRMADYSFDNNGSKEELFWKVDEILSVIGYKQNESVAVGGSVVAKREGVLSWDDYFMSVAVLSSKRSKDPNSQVGACIVDKKKRILGVGYNGFPIGCSDDDFPWARKGDFLNVKYTYICHAELNAILNSHGKNLDGATIYVDLFPCNECAKAIIQSGIREVVYLSDKYVEEDSTKASKKMMDSSGVKYRQLSPSKNSVNLDLSVNK